MFWTRQPRFSKFEISNSRGTITTMIKEFFLTSKSVVRCIHTHKQTATVPTATTQVTTGTTTIVRLHGIHLHGSVLVSKLLETTYRTINNIVKRLFDVQAEA